MNEPDFSAFAALWQQEPPDEEVRIFRKLARRASRRARLQLYAETWFGVAIAGAAVLAFFFAPSLLTGTLAAILALTTFWAAWRRHVLEGVAAELSRNDRQAMLRSSARAARAALRKSNIGLVTAFPGWLAAILLAWLASHGGDYDALRAELPDRMSAPSTIVSVLIVIVVTLAAGRRNRELRRELRRIETLSAAYRDEDLLDRAASTGGKRRR